MIAALENKTSDSCAQRTFKSACASALSDQSLRYPHEETLHPWLYKMLPVKMKIVQAGPEIIKLFFMLNSAENEICFVYKS